LIDKRSSIEGFSTIPYQVFQNVG